MIEAAADVQNAKAAAEFAANSMQDKDFRVPAVIWPASARRVLTLEWAEGVNLGDVIAEVTDDKDLRTPTELSRRQTSEVIDELMIRAKEAGVVALKRFRQTLD